MILIYQKSDTSEYTVSDKLKSFILYSQLGILYCTATYPYIVVAIKP